MMVVADTSPLNYLIQIYANFILERLYAPVVLPAAAIPGANDENH